MKSIQHWGYDWGPYWERNWRNRTFVMLIVLAIWVAINLFRVSPAFALTPITLSDLSYHDCPAELADGIVSSGGAVTRPANCFIVTGKAENTSPRPVVDADIFGRIYDANNNPVMQNRNRLGSIPYVPMGMSDFELRISVPDKMDPPLRFDKFKASGFSSTVSQFGNIEYDEFDEMGEQADGSEF